MLTFSCIISGKFLDPTEGVKNCNIYMCFNKMPVRCCKICVVL